MFELKIKSFVIVSFYEMIPKGPSIIYIYICFLLHLWHPKKRTEVCHNDAVSSFILGSFVSGDMKLS